MMFYIPGQQFYAPQEVAFQYGVMGLLGICYFIPRRRELSSFFLGAILLYALINTVLFHFKPEHRMILLNMFLGFVFIKEVAERVDLNLKSIGNMLALFCALNVVWIAFQLHNIDPVFSSSNPQNMPQVDVVGWMGLKSNLGTLAALSFPFIFFSSPLSSIIVLPLLWYGRSSSAIASVMLTLFFILWFKNRKIFFVSLVLAGIGGIFYVLGVDMPTGEFQKRFPVWFAGVSLVARTSPWFGTGLGNWALTSFTTIQGNGEPQKWVWAHNTFVQWFYELGLFGLLLLLAYLKGITEKISFQIKEHVQAMALLIPLVLTSAIHFPWHIARFAGLSCFMIACIEALLSKKEDLYEKITDSDSHCDCVNGEFADLLAS
jgi:hypothetical protein